MSDHRFQLKIQFSIYGMNFEWEPDLNWNNHTGGVDDRIIDWFTDCYAKARAEFETENDREQKRRAAATLEESERAELVRLKAKYEPLTTILVPEQDFDWRAVVIDDGPVLHGDAAASPWTSAYDREGWGRMSLPDGEHGVRWHDPTPAGDFSVAGIVCRVCGHKVAMKSGDVIKRGDPRLCEHLGGCTCAPGTARTSCPVHGIDATYEEKK